MTEKDAYKACLIELNKVKAPALLLDDFVYLFNKCIQQYFNKKYNVFEINQQATDDMRVLTNSIRIDSTNGLSKHNDTGDTSTFEDSYNCILPKDYVHILNVVCEFKDNQPVSRCNKGKTKLIRHGANKLDTNQWSSVITNYYMRPSINQPYYYIININGDSDPADQQYYNKQGVPIKNQVKEKESGQRYGNATQPIMQIKYGNDMSRYTLEAVYLDYLRAPKYVKLEKSHLDENGDSSNVLEFPDYVIYEIINEMVKLVTENAQDPRVQTQPAVTTTIGSGMYGTK